ncbi:MAG TPA: GNAT family N-acetyltransferase [Candidatus Omnitrophota bacterium]|nr:GNAT family N-acetyltransferase [Candidatus Omnitrophota bacterium]
MLIIRPADGRDRAAIVRIMDEADLRYKNETFDQFYLAEADGVPAGVVRLDEHAGYIFLTTLGVASVYLRKGIGRALMEFAIGRSLKDIYIYTIIPEFFAKFGFVPAPAPADLPQKNIFDCDECFPGKCVTMVRKHAP